MGALTEFSLAKRGYHGESPEGYISSLEAKIVHRIPQKWFWKEAKRHQDKAIHIKDVILMPEAFIVKLYRIYREMAKKGKRVNAYDPMWLQDDYRRANLDEDEISAYYAVRWERVREKAQRVLPDGRVAIDLGMVYG